MHKYVKVLLGLAAIAVAPTASLHAAEQATVSKVAAAQTVGFDVFLPLRNRTELQQLLGGQQTPGNAQYHKWLTPAQFHARFGPTDESLKAAQRELSNLGFTVTAASPQQLHVSGQSAMVERAFSTNLGSTVSASGKARVVASTPIALTPTLSSLGATVIGLNNKVRMHVHAKLQATPTNRYNTSGPYWFTDLKQAYNWPSYTTLTGKGVNIGILMSGGFQLSDMNLYFAHEKLATPTFQEIKVLGGAPYNPNGDSFETHLDLQQSGGMAPNSVITLYNIPDLSDLSIIVGLAEIVTLNTADVVSMSFGGAETFYTAAYNDGVDYTSLLKVEDDLMAQGNAQGITFVASSGDSGALPVPPLACFTNVDPTAACGRFQPSAEFPASSPHVTGVGGSNLATTSTSGNLNSQYLYEQAYGDPLARDIFYGTAATGGYWGSGGGNSAIFPRPDYQTLVPTGSTTFRTVPDLSLHMGGCPGGTVYCNPDDSADLEYLSGKLYGVIGTSASAPDFAGLTALNIERLGSRLGNENYYIYGLAAAQSNVDYQAFHRNVPGYNGLYSTATGTIYNRVLGLGTLRANQFLQAPQLPLAGIPQSPTNP